MSLVTEIAKAVVAELNRHDFSQEFEAVYTVKPSYEPAELDTLRVAVVPKTVELERLSRLSAKYTVSVDVGVMQRIGKRTPEEAVETLGDLVDEIADHLSEKPLSEFKAATLNGITNEPVYLPEHLTQLRTFTSVLNVQYVLMSD